MNKVAAIQMCSTPNVQENLDRAADLIRKASKENATLIVLPEMFCIAGNSTADKLDVKEKLGEGLIQNFLSQQAEKYKVWIVGGTIPIAIEGQKRVRAASLVFNSKGKQVARYDKIHLFDVTISDKEFYRESEITEPGKDITVIDTPIGKLGLAVCYDIRFPELFRAMFNQGAQIFSLPSAFTMKTGEAHWELLLRSQAVQNLSYIIGAAQAGRHQSGRETYGHSIIVNPWGKIIAEKKESEPGYIMGEIDLNYLKQLRDAMPVMSHQKIFATK